ncbi:MAG TPA: hypothetical protein VFB58_11925 [Chloroflexota bacterium]|nr:hypothetical protein [Chloroflexota bacterium]
MSTTTPFIEQLEGDLRRAHGRQASRRRRRGAALLAAVSAFVFVAAAGASGTIQGWFTIDNSGQGVNIVGSPPATIDCGPAVANGPCVLSTTATATSGIYRYGFSHTLGQDLPNTSTGSLQESDPGQAVFDKQGHQMVPPQGAALSYVCTTITTSQLTCSPLGQAGGTLPRGAAIYILAPSEYVEPTSG